MKITANIILAGVFIGIGFLLGWFVRDWLCPDTNTAIVNQLDKDADSVKELKKKEQIRYVEVEKVKTVIEKVVDTTGCADIPNDELGAIVLEAYNKERPQAD